MKISFFFLISSIVTALYTHAVAQSHRLEVEVSSLNQKFNSIPLDKEGLIIIYQTGNRGQMPKKDVWNIARYDTSFSEIWHFESLLMDTPQEMAVDFLTPHAYFFLRKGPEYQVLKINIFSGESELTSGKIFKKNFTINEVKGIGNSLYVSGIVQPTSSQTFLKSCAAFVCFPLVFIPNFMPEPHSSLVHINLTTKSTRDILLSKKSTVEYDGWSPDTTTQSAWVTYHSKGLSKQQAFIAEIKPNGAKGKTLEIQPRNPNYKLLGGKSVKMGESVFLVGTYGRRRGSGAQGLYLARLQKGSQDFIQYYSFSDLSTFFDYLPEDEKTKLKKRIDKKRKRGKDLTYGFQMIQHDLVVDSHTIYAVSEVFFPRYHTEYRTSWVYGRPVEVAVEVFDGYEYTHTLVLALDTSGNRKYDRTVNISGIKTFDLYERVHFYKDERQWSLSYLNDENKLRYHLYSDSVEISKGVFNDPKALLQKGKNSTYYKVKPWYSTKRVAQGMLKQTQTDSYYPTSKYLLFFERVDF